VTAEALPAASRDAARGILFILVAVLLFAGMDALVKLAAARHPVGQIVFFRNLFAFLPLLFFIRRAGGLPALRTRRLRQHVLRSLAGVASMACTFLAFSLLPLADAVALCLSAPIFLTALSVPLLGERVGWRRWSAVVVGFLGILVMTRPGSGVFELGAALAVAAALLYALAMIQVNRMAASEPPAAIVFYFTLCAALLGGASLPWQWVTPTAASLACLIAIGLIGGFAQMALTLAYGLAPVSVAAPFEYLSLIFAAGFGYAIWGDLPDSYILLGAAIVVGSGLYILHRETLNRRSAARSPRRRK
jgi:drug/metabolite transporter (DMT)-like permease